MSFPSSPEGAVFVSSLDESCLDDMQALPTLTDASFMHMLQRRFETKHVYTYSGPRIAVSVNPCDWQASLPLYSSEQRETYRHERRGEGGSGLPPHLYAVAETARRQRALGHVALGGLSGRSQSLLVSGESGAGKTEAVKIMLQYLAQQGASHPASCTPSAAPQPFVPMVASPAACRRGSSSRLVGQLIELNPLLEAFGNATTSLNHNSSRFGKLMVLHYGPCDRHDAEGSIVGGSIQVYLLEKVRVVRHERGECNFHIFYQVSVRLTVARCKKRQVLLQLSRILTCAHLGIHYVPLIIAFVPAHHVLCSLHPTRSA
jgi:myosin heavy subunit